MDDGVHTPHEFDALRNRLSSAPYPLEPSYQRPVRPWHASYPDYVPPGIDFTPLRVEQLLIRATDQFPKQMALRYFHTNWTYEELLRRVRQVAANLKRLGIESGDRVMLVLPNSPEYVVAWFALHWLGAEIVHANPLMTASDFIRLAIHSRAKAAFGLDFRLASVLEMAKHYHIRMLFVSSLAPHLPVHLRLPYRFKCWMQGGFHTPQTEVYTFDDLYRHAVAPSGSPSLSDPLLPGVLQPTGGTTGTPKIAVLSHKNLHANVAQLHAWCGLNPGEETVLAVLPFFHVFGSTVALLSAVAGAATLILQANFNPSRVFRVMDQHKPDVAPMVPFMFARLCEEMQRRGRNLKGMRYCFSGASPLDPELKAEFEERTGANIFEGFGLSECSPVTHANPADGSARGGSIGLPLPDTEVRIVDAETGTIDLPVGEVGELIIRGPQVMDGYLDEPEETSYVLRDGWLHTGDLATMAEDGYFTIVDRKKDLIISGGLNVYPAEVEAALIQHASVLECAVIGVPCKKFGEAVAAFVIASPGFEIHQDILEAHCRSKLASYKIPRTIEVREDLPKNFLGKVRRIELRNPKAA
ncbi:MAG: AMP-binding protein [Planctomycetota bacterium]|nr:AMP-binding protein [Planctomycetota bacterium]